MSEQCVKHHFDMAEGQCRSCGYLFCGGCLVFPGGPSKPPFCINCAMVKGGVRSTAGNVPLTSPRDIRRLEKDRKRSARMAAKAERKAAPQTPSEQPPGVIPAPLHPIPPDRSGQRPARRSRSATRAFCIEASVMASISTTSKAALRLPSMATVATGMPLGICTVA